MVFSHVAPARASFETACEPLPWVRIPPSPIWPVQGQRFAGCAAFRCMFRCMLDAPLGPARGPWRRASGRQRAAIGLGLQSAAWNFAKWFRLGTISELVRHSELAVYFGKQRLVTVRFAPKSGHSSAHVCFVPKADVARLERALIKSLRGMSALPPIADVRQPA